MRILIQECKKMLSVRLLLLLALFTVLFYNMFFELNLYPAGGQCTDSPYDMPYAAKLIRKYGSTLPVTEKGKIEKEVEDLHQRTREGIATARLNGKQIGQKQGAKLITKKSIEAKRQIQKYSKDFDGQLTDVECMRMVGLARNTYYKYKKEMKAE